MINIEGVKANRRKGLIILLFFAILAVFMVVANYYGTNTLSAVRTYIGAEGQWTKAQKEATNYLIRYTLYKDSTYYNEFQSELELHRVFKKSRQTLISDNPNHQLAKEGFESANIPENDIEQLIWLTVNFKNYALMQEALAIWSQGDEQISQLNALSEKIRESIQEDQLNLETRDQYISEIVRIDEGLTLLENEFSATMGRAARWIQKVVFWSIAISSIILIGMGYLLVQSYFRGISKLNRELRRSENKFKRVLDHTRDVVYEIDIATGDYNYMSPYIEQMVGYSRDEIYKIGRDFLVNNIHPDHLKEIKKEQIDVDKNTIEELFTEENEFKLKRRDGRYIWVNIQRSLVKNEDGIPEAIVGSMRDISDRKKYELEIEKSLEEKQVLLEEIHHRVKNNLAVISSILELQKNDPQHASLEEIMEDTQKRIKSIAMIHEKLYKTETFSDINVRDYINEFSNAIYNTYDNSQFDIEFNSEMDSFTLEINRALPLGLIYNELLNNVFKHGFKDKKQGKINVSLKKENGSITLTVADNGNPLNEDFEITNSQSLGMTLIQTLTQQLQGEVNVIQNNWTKFIVTFPLEET